MRIEFPWAVRVPNNDHACRCKYDGRVINVSNGAYVLKQHSEMAVHKTHVMSLCDTQPTIIDSLHAATQAEDGELKALFLHCLKIVMDGSSFRTSDSSNRKRKIYKQMFPDSKFSSFSCGKTKANYVCVFGIAPYVVSQLKESLAGKTFGLHLDESAYNKKCIIEYWIVYYSGGERKNHFLNAVELEIKVTSDDILGVSSKKSLADFHLLDSETVFHATVQTVQQFDLDVLNLRYLMTDNCSIMQGAKTGFVEKMKGICPNLVSIPGCASHQVNLLQKDTLNSSEPNHLIISEIVTFVQNLSNFVENSPKVRSLLKQMDNLIGLRQIPDYCPTRFLQFFEILESVLEQYNLLRKIVSLSKDKRLARTMNDNKFIIHLDQLFIHIHPLYKLNKKTQEKKLNVFELLVALLQCISQLLSRLGYSVQLIPSKYVDVLFKRAPNSSKAERLPCDFESRNRQLLITTQNKCVVKALHSETQAQEDNIRQTWDSVNELQIKCLLKRFARFLTSPITVNCFSVFIPVQELDNDSLESLMVLTRHLRVDDVKVRDEVCELRTTLMGSSASTSFSDLFRDGKMESCPALRNVVETILLICPHNMNVESGFSLMKSTESPYQNRQSMSTYNAIRTIKTFYDRSNFEQVDVPEALLNNIKNAASKFTKEKNAISSKNVEKREIASSLRASIGIFKRHTPFEIKRAEKRIEKEMLLAEEQLARVKRRKEQLEIEKMGPSCLANRASQNIIDRMWNSKVR